jgi:predicted nucleotidyltransferase component of viral defense system
MIKKNCFTGEWLDSFKRLPDYRRIDRIILEKMIYALHLLECIQESGLTFVFKGGTSLVLLLKEDSRFSIDIDIICKSEREYLETKLDKVIEISNFKSFALDDQRSFQPGVPKIHYAFEYDSVIQTRYSGKILLDILVEESMYPELIEIPVQTKWIDSEGETIVIVPTVESITGDKLTAFAPNTVGIPYFKGNQSFAMELCKQLFDLGRLFDRIIKVDVVAKSFRAFAEQEIAYRKNENNSFNITPEDVLRDIFDTCLIVTKREANREESAKKNFKLLQDGIRSLNTGFIMSGNFRIDEAIAASARVAYLSAKIMVNDLSSVYFFKGQDIEALNIEDSEWSFLNRLKRLPNKAAYYYWYHAVQLLISRKK